MKVIKILTNILILYGKVSFYREFIMRIKYVGPKVIFSRHGIDFDNNKEDKYAYINIAIQIYQAFEHEYNPGEKYVYNTSSKRLSDSEILDFIHKNFSHHDKLLEDAKQDANEYFEREKKRAAYRQGLISEEEYNSWIKNIDLMQDYTIQRYFNKKIYYAIINKIGERIKQRNIAEVHAPMYQKFVHVLHSLQGVLSKKPNPLNSTLEIFEQEGTLMVKLYTK